ncbi:MAG TPA: APC family permease [Ktedonobacteraceae bacterium]|nr:APC family permease [Ktedonobacteraceae bacterium]
MSSETHVTRRYEQQLARAIGVLGNICITVSGITPTASIFIIAPVAFANQGSGTFLAFIIAAIIGLGMAMCYSELGSAFPIVGGQYSIVARVLGRPVGFLAFVDFLALAIFIPSSIALGAGQYVAVLFPAVNNANLVGLIVMVVTTLIAILSIRFNAVITGIFLAIELLAVGTVTVVGFTHVHQPLSILFVPQTAGPHNVVSFLSLGVVLAGVSTAIFAYNGYDAPIIYSEETTGPRRGIARAVLWSLGITIVAELVPVTAALLGTPSLQGLVSSSTPMSYVLTSLGGPVLNALVTVGVLLAIFNGNIAIMLTYGRLVYSSGRDKAWPEPISGWLAKTHPTLRSPWVATAIVGLIGALLTYFSNVAALVTFTGVLLVILYGLVALSALVSRFTQRGLARPYKMPLWPLWPIIGLAGCVIVFTQQTLSDIGICAAIFIVAGIYYVVYLRQRQSTHWLMLAPTQSEEVEAPLAAPVEGLDVGADAGN